MSLKQIYISPSNQHNNVYADKKTTEKQNCEIIASHVKTFLNEYDVEVNNDVKSYNSGGYGGRPQAAASWVKNKSEALYLSIHTNAAGTAVSQTGAYGPFVIYTKKDLQPLAQSLRNALREIMPKPSAGSDRASPLNQQPNANGTWTWGEPRDVTALGMAMVLVEVDFHDNPNIVPSLTTKQVAIGQAIAKQIINFYGLKKNVNSTPIRGISEIVDINILTAFIQKNNPNFNPEIARQFIQQGKIYNIRGDIALCQSVIETGWFKFEVTAVKPSQNNFCGMGVTSLGMPGNSFATIELGVKAQVQHLFAYACRDALPSGEKLVDPRWSYVTRGSAPNWVDLSGKWAAATNYGQSILKKYDELKVFSAAYKSPTPKYYKIQLGAYSVLKNAENKLKEVKAKGFIDAFVTPMGADKLYRVQLGAFSQKANADAKLADVKKAGFNAFVKFE